MSRRLRLIALALGLVVVVVLCWFLLLSPLRESIAETNRAVSVEQTRLAAAQAKLAQAESTRIEGKKNRALMLQLSKMVPQSPEVPSLLLQIQDLADQAGIDFIAITPGDPSSADGFEIVPLQLEFVGTYFDLSDFIYRTEQMVAGPGRLLAVKSIQLDLGGSTAEATTLSNISPPLGVSMTMYAFTMASPPAGTPATETTTPSAP